MVKRKEDVVSMSKPGPFQGTGEIMVRDILNGSEELHERGRVSAHTTVYSDSGTDYHVCDNESEIYYTTSRTETSNDNGKLVEIGPGDATFTGDGESHSIEVTNGEPIKMTALILYHNIA